MLFRFVLDKIPPAKANNAKVYTSRKGKKFYTWDKRTKELLTYITNKIREQNTLDKPINTLVELRVYFILPNKRKRDIDNIIKSLQDILEKAKIITNDNNIYRIVSEKSFIKGCELCYGELHEYNISKEMNSIIEKYLND